jgi:hypothetical protein
MDSLITRDEDTRQLKCSHPSVVQIWEIGKLGDMGRTTQMVLAVIVKLKDGRTIEFEIEDMLNAVACNFPEVEEYLKTLEE